MIRQSLSRLLGLSDKRALRRIAALLAAVMSYEAAAMPLAEAAVLSGPAPIESNVPASISNAGIGARPASSSDFIAPFKIPAAVGSTVEIHAPLSAGRLIYHLQDVHSHVPAQTNLSEMVSRLEAYAADQKKVLIVAVEGASGVIDTDKLSAHPSESVKKAVSSALLRSGFLLGEEHAAINHAPGRIKIVGVETPALYNRNVIARERSSEGRERILVTVREIREQLNRLKAHNFNDLLNTLEKNRLAVEDGRMAMSDYLTFLSRTSPAIVKKYPMVSRMLALSEQEKNLDFSKVEKEGRLLVEEIISKNSDKQVEKMMKDAVALREGRLSPLSYYNGLLAQADRIYPALKSYVVYLRESEAINPDALFLEVQKVEVETAKELVRHPLAYELYKNIRWIERQEKFFSLNMIPQEWELQKNTDIEEIFAMHDDIRGFVSEQVQDLGYQFATPPFSMNDLRVAVRGARDFYRAAEARDAEMVANLDKTLKDLGRDNAIVALIAGGFHTPGVTRELRGKGLAYQVIRPQIETDVALDKSLNYAAVAPSARLLPERSVTDFLRPASNLTPAGVAAVDAAMRQGGRRAPIVDRSRDLEASGTTLMGRLSAVWSPLTNRGVVYTGAEYVVLGALLASIAIVAAFIFIAPLRALVSRLFRGNRQEAAPAPVRTDYQIDLSKPDDSGIELGSRTDTDIATFVRTSLRLPAPPSDQSAGGSGDVLALLTSEKNLDVAKVIRIETIAAVANVIPVYVRDIADAKDVVRNQDSIYIPERYIRASSPAVLEPTDDNGFTAYDRSRLAEIEMDAAEAAAAGKTAAQLHNDQMDATYMQRLDAALRNPANQTRFENAYPGIIAAELAEMGQTQQPEGAASSAAENAAAQNAGRLPIADLAAKWYAESNAVRGRDVSDPSQVSDEELARATRATTNLSRLIELVSAVPEGFYDETEPADENPTTFADLGAADPKLSDQAIADSQQERDLALYFGLLPLRIFAGGSWTRGGLNVPAALVTPAQLATAGSINIDEFPGLFTELQQVARPILDRRVEVARAAARLGLPVEAGLANQRIEIGVSDSNSDVIDQFFTDAEFLGFPAVTFRFFEQRTGKGFGFQDGNIVRQDDLALQGPVTDVPYGHLELEVTHNKPNSYYVLSNDGTRHQGGASLNRVLASNRQVLIHQQISLLHAWRSGWSTRPEWIHYIITRMIKGNQEYVAQLANNAKSGQKAGLLPRPVSGQLSAAFKAYAGINPADNRPRQTVFVEGNQTQVPEGKRIRDERAGVWVNAAITAAKPAALEKVAALENAPLVLTVRGNKIKRGDTEYQYGAAVYPDGASYGMNFNGTVSEAIAPNATVRADGVSDADRFEVKQPNEFRQALETAQRQDADPEFRAIAQQVVETTRENRAKRPTQPISPAVPFIVGVILFAAFYLSFGNAPLGIDAMSGYASTVLGIAAAISTGFGVIGAVIARGSVDVPADTTIDSIRNDARFSAARVQAVVDFAAAAKRSEADPLNVVIRPGILAEVDPATRTLYVGSGLLKASNGFTGLIRAIVLHVALRHEFVHLSRFQVPSTNRLYRFLNEVLAYVAGGIAVFVPGFILFGSAVVDASGSYRGRQTDAVTPAIGAGVDRFAAQASAALFNPDYRSKPSDLPSYVAVNADELGVGNMTDKEIEGFVALNFGLHEKVRDQLKPGAQVIFYSASGDARQTARIERLVAAANNQIKGVSFGFKPVAGPVTDVSSVFDASVRANLTKENTIVLTKTDTGFGNVKVVAVTNLPHLAVATFAYSHYRDGDAVLTALLGILEFAQLRTAGSLENDILTEIVAKLSA